MRLPTIRYKTQRQDDGSWKASVTDRTMLRLYWYAAPTRADVSRLVYRIWRPYHLAHDSTSAKLE